MSQALLGAMAGVVGADSVSTATADRLANSRGVWPIEIKRACSRSLPPLPVVPFSEAALSAAAPAGVEVHDLLTFAAVGAVEV